ncbi:MAG: hypothetical protein KAR07_05805, partial [Spirochaetes bacterium]|nr:hypothetical protein [Spirochaetota bacterium]
GKFGKCLNKKIQKYVSITQSKRHANMKTEASFGCIFYKGIEKLIRFSILKRIFNSIRTKKTEYYRNIFVKFVSLFNTDFSPNIVRFLNMYPVKDLQYLHILCKDDEGKTVWTGFKQPERITSLLNNEITRRLQNRIVYLSILALLISFIFLLISILCKKAT